MNELNFQKIEINKILCDHYNFDGTFIDVKKLEEFVKKNLSQMATNIQQIDKENILAKK